MPHHLPKDGPEPALGINGKWSGVERRTFPPKTNERVCFAGGPRLRGTNQAPFAA